MQFAVLGPLAVSAESGPLRLGGARPRAVLAVLLLEANRVVSTDRLLGAVWGDELATARLPSLHVHVSALRKSLEAAGGVGRLVTVAPGYRLTVEPGELDSARFEELVRRGREARGAPGQARELLKEALALWRGPLLADLPDADFFLPEAARLEELRIGAVEDRVEADLALGRHAEVAEELDALVEQHPVRERLWGQLMLALYRGGRQADALRAFGRARSVLVEEYGIDPGPVLRELERSVLAQDAGLAAPAAQPVANGQGPPQAANPLLGRSEEVAEVLAHLRGPGRLLTLTGPGGSGKTRLAVEICRQLFAELGGAAWFVRLEAVTASAMVPGVVAKALGVGDRVDAGPVAEQIAAELRGPGLLVLDNLEHLLDAAPFVRDLLAAAPQLSVLVTSRAPLRLSGEQEYPVQPLALPPAAALPDTEAAARRYGAVELFLDRTRAACPHFEADSAAVETIAQICLRLDGLPLALELAAARLKILTPAALLDRLGRSLDLLAGGARDLPGRQRTLRATLQWSHDLLPPEQQVLLSRLSVFAGGFTLEAAEEVCGTGDLPVLDALAALVDNSLVRAAAGGVRFVLLQTVQLFASEQLVPDGPREQVQRRHADYFLQLAQDSRERIDRADGAVRLHQLEVELGNLRAAHAFLVGTGQVEQVSRLAVALRPYWQAQGRLLEGIAWLDAVLEDDALAEASRAEAATAAAVLTYYRHDWPGAQIRLLAALELARRAGARPAQGMCLCLLGAVAAVGGEPAEGARLVAEAQEVLVEAPDYEARVTALSVLALVSAVRGDTVGEREHYEQRLAMVRERGDRLRAADTLNDLAEIALDEGDLGQARRRGAEALQLARGLGTMQTRDTLVTLGRVALQEGDARTATELLAEAVALSVGLRQSFGLAQSLRALAAAAQAEGADRRAVLLFAAAERLHPTLRGERGAFERDIDDALVSAREHLADDFDRTWAAGSELAPDEVIDLALGARAAERLLRA